MDQEHDVKQLDWEGQDLDLRRHNSGLPGISTRGHKEYSDTKESHKGIKGSGISLRKRSLGEGSDYAMPLGNKFTEMKEQASPGQTLKMIKMEDETQHQNKAPLLNLRSEMKYEPAKKEEDENDELAEILDINSQAEGSFNALDDFIDPSEKEEMFEYKDEEEQ